MKGLKTRHDLEELKKDKYFSKDELGVQEGQKVLVTEEVKLEACEIRKENLEQGV